MRTSVTKTLWMPSSGSDYNIWRNSCSCSSCSNSPSSSATSSSGCGWCICVQSKAKQNKNPPLRIPKFSSVCVDASVRPVLIKQLTTAHQYKPQTPFLARERGELTLKIENLLLHLRFWLDFRCIFSFFCVWYFTLQNYKLFIKETLSVS